jgi:hypothetical protein
MVNNAIVEELWQVHVKYKAYHQLKQKYTLNIGPLNHHRQFKSKHLRQHM